jgi:hypothetical protein
MKTLFTAIVLTAAVFYTACGDNKGKTEKTDNTTSSNTRVVTDDTVLKKTGTVGEIVSGYINLKNALVNDNNKEAIAAANEINASVQNVNLSSLTPEQKKTYDELKDDIREHAEHIASSEDIAHQREHFDLLSADMIDLVKAAGSSQLLYRDFCPMYNNKKGAFWLSETKEIKNPYYGKEMRGCGEVKEEIKPKG